VTCESILPRNTRSMKDASPEKSYIDRIRSWASTKAHGGSHRSSKRPDANSLPISNPLTVSSTRSQHTEKSDNGAVNAAAGRGGAKAELAAKPGPNHDPGDGGSPPSAASPPAERQGPVVGPGGDEGKQEMIMAVRFFLTAKAILLYSKLNLLLVFVPVGIAVKFIPGATPGLIFAMNAIAIIPLAGLLSFATEAVARRLGDTVGALLNVTFGNAVELIIL
jgi:Ca2+:H+ antiporter